MNPSNPRTMMGFDTAADQRVTLPVRDWSALKLALWRSRWGWEIALRAASEIVERCEHESSCPGAEQEHEPCLSSCPDREQRMSALVVLNAARMFAPIDVRRPANEPYMAPSREYYSQVMAELAITQVELDQRRITDEQTKFALDRLVNAVNAATEADPLLPSSESAATELDDAMDAARAVLLTKATLPQLTQPKEIS